VLVDTAVLTSDRKKHARSEKHADIFHGEVSRKADMAFSKPHKDGSQSKLATFRIPRKQNLEDSKTNSSLDSARFEKSKVNFASEMSQTTGVQKPFGSKATASAALSAHNNSRNSTIRNCFTGSYSEPTKPCSDKHRHEDLHTNKRQLQNSVSAVGDGKGAVTQIDQQESTPKLPDELVRAGWKLCWSKHRYRWYVFNVRTGTSSWDVPK